MTVPAKPYWLKLPFDLSSLLNRLYTFVSWLLMVSAGTFVGYWFLRIFDAWDSGWLFILGFLLPWLLLILYEIYVQPNRRRWNLTTKWCFVPPSESSKEQPRAWIQTPTDRQTIDEPGFYLLKPGFHAVFVGTKRQWRHHLDMAMNGGL